MSRLRFLLPLAAFLALAAMLAVGLGLDPRAVPSPLIDKPAPAFALGRLDAPQTLVRTADLRGKPFVLNVWASWCVPCRVEHPVIVELGRRTPVPIYGLNYKDEAADAKAWLARFGDPFRAVLVDRDGRAGLDLGVYGVPETFVVDAAGTIRYKHVGPLTPDVVRETIEPLLRKLAKAADA
jgi:cytochrome c biogenesis protein CcmG/thiol:disulfide interchange protein DsbE